MDASAARRRARDLRRARARRRIPTRDDARASVERAHREREVSRVDSRRARREAVFEDAVHARIRAASCEPRAGEPNASTRATRDPVASRARVIDMADVRPSDADKVRASASARRRGAARVFLFSNGRGHFRDIWDAFGD